MPPYLDQNSAVLQVSQIVNLILPIFINIPLLTTKSIDFNCFAKAVEIKNKSIKNNKLLSNSDFINILKLKQSINSLRKNNTNIQIQIEKSNKIISPYWLLGFVEGSRYFWL